MVYDDSLLQLLAQLLAEWGCTGQSSMLLASCLLSVAYVILVAIVYRLLINVVSPMLRNVTIKTPTRVDDILLRKDFMRWLWCMLSAMMLRYLLQTSLVPFETICRYVDVIMDVVVIGFGTKVLVELVKGIFMIVFDHRRIGEEAERIHKAENNNDEYAYVPSHSLKGLQQMICIVIWCIGAILMVAVLFGRSPLLIVSGLGAGAAVLMLVFKDSILGVVAGVQLTANDMLRPGDWIVSSAHGANGRVLEVTLATVKVKNWDHSIVTIPPYQLISQSFQNWRSMEQSGGRRVMRSFNIDMTTVRFMTDSEREKYAQEPWAADLEPCRWVNLTVFRSYLKHYISSLDTLNNDMLYMVRELQPTPQGLPIEIYFFTSRTSWEAYEQVQAAALDHILAVVKDFGLCIFQSPTGADLRTLHLPEQ